MRKLNTRTPFDILLDQYSNEAYNLYIVVKSLGKYPNVTQDGYEDLEAKLYSTAFAQLISNYLNSVVNMYEYEDWDEFIHIMNFENDRDDILKIASKHHLNLEEEFSEIVWEVARVYKKNIITNLENLFCEKAKIIQLFASIFQFNEEDDSHVDFLDSNHFFQKEFN